MDCIQNFEGIYLVTTNADCASRMKVISDLKGRKLGGAGKPKSISEQCIDVVTMVNDSIYFTRIGVNSNRKFKIIK